MTTALTLVLNSFREGNLVPLDATTGLPVVNQAQINEGLTILNGYVDSLYGMELGEFNFDWAVPPILISPVAANYPNFPVNNQLPSQVWPYPPGNVRILMNLQEDTTIYLAQSPDNGARVQFINIGDPTTYSLTVVGNTRLVKGVATITETPGDLSGQRLLYRSDLASWHQIAVMLETDESPLPLAYDQLLQIGTFQGLAPRYGRSMSPELIETQRRLMKRMKTDFKQKVVMPSAKPNPFQFPASDINNGQLLIGGAYTLGSTLP
tara:strand:+ start:11284 stop:12078 length:795 start_codon:yes stop_codon:yes gene_type:complete